MDYILVKSKKRKKNIEARIINNDIYIYAPLRANKKNIDDFYQKIKNKLVKSDTRYIKIFGNDYIIKENTSPLLKKPCFEIINDNFMIYRPVNYIDCRDDLMVWKKNKLKKFIEDRVKYYISKYNFNFSFEKNKISYKNQRTIWGSCSFCNNLNFNCNLIEKRLEVIDYVIVHELCHTIHKNHSKNFWQEVKSILPNCFDLREELKKR